MTNFVDNVSTCYGSLIPRLQVKPGNETTIIVVMECENFSLSSSCLAVISCCHGHCKTSVPY